MLNGHLVPVNRLQSQDVERMLALMVAHYDRVDEQHFLEDLAEKEGCIVLYDDRGAIQGFSSYLFLRTTHRSRPVTALFSGDTIVDNSHWGSPELFCTFARLLNQMLSRYDQSDCYWFLLTQGVRTYLMLPLHFKDFTPSYERTPSADEADLLRHLARLKCGERFDSEKGIVRSDGYSLKRRYRALGERRMRNPHVHFFLERNEGCERGEELACLCPIHPGNFRRRTVTMVGRV